MRTISCRPGLGRRCRLIGSDTTAIPWTACRRRACSVIRVEVLVVVVIVRGMPVPVMPVVEVVVVHDGAVAAPVAVDVIVVERVVRAVLDRGGHRRVSPSRTAAAGKALLAHVDRAWVITARIVDGTVAGTSRASVAGRCGTVLVNTQHR